MHCVAADSRHVKNEQLRVATTQEKKHWCVKHLLNAHNVSCHADHAVLLCIAIFEMLVNVAMCWPSCLLKSFDGVLLGGNAICRAVPQLSISLQSHTVDVTWEHLKATQIYYNCS